MIHKNYMFFGLLVLSFCNAENNASHTIEQTCQTKQTSIEQETISNTESPKTEVTCTIPTKAIALNEKIVKNLTDITLLCYAITVEPCLLQMPIYRARFLLEEMEKGGPYNIFSQTGCSGIKFNEAFKAMRAADKTHQKLSFALSEELNKLNDAEKTVFNKKKQEAEYAYLQTVETAIKKTVTKRAQAK